VAQDELDARGAQAAGAVVEEEWGPDGAHTRIVAYARCSSRGATRSPISSSPNRS
jgi:hypothetical protein